MAESAVHDALTEQGYDVKRIKTEDGCYEAYVRDSEGHRLELYIHPVSGEEVRRKEDD
jgi:hypothetical protein